MKIRLVRNRRKNATMGVEKRRMMTECPKWARNVSQDGQVSLVQAD